MYTGVSLSGASVTDLKADIGFLTAISGKTGAGEDFVNLDETGILVLSDFFVDFNSFNTDGTSLVGREMNLSSSPETILDKKYFL